MLNQSSSNAWTLVAYYIEPIRHFFDDPAVTSIAVLRYDAIKIRRNGRWETTDAKFDSEQTLVTAIKQIINSLGQQIDEKSAPIADARLEDGSRVNAVLYPTAHMGSNMTIRIFPKVRYSLDDLVDKGAVTKEIVDFLQLATLCRYNCLISGATGSGKTTVLNAMGNLIPEHLRIGLIEDTAELKLNKPNLIAMEAPKRAIRDSTGKQVVTMESLLVNTLRQELDTVVVGEIREPTAATALMLALNTGHQGVLSTLHANSPQKALERFINLILSNDTRVPYEAVLSQVYDNIDLVIQTEKTPRHGQRIVEIAEIRERQLVTLFRWNYIHARHECLITADQPARLYAMAPIYDAVLPATLLAR